MQFIPRQKVKKNLVDGVYREVSAWRYECCRCGSTLRVYPEGGSRKQLSQRVTGMAILLYLLGLSYGAVELALGSFGVAIGKSKGKSRRTKGDQEAARLAKGSVK